MRSYAFILLLVLAVAPVCYGKGAGESADVLVNAKTACVMAQLGAVGSGRTRPNAKRAKAQVEDALKKWGRLQVVEDPAKADLVMVITESTVPASQTSSYFPMAPHKSYSMDLLSDSLAVYQGGGLKEDSKPVWKAMDAGEDAGPPIERLVGKLRNDIKKGLIESAVKN